MSIIRDVVKGAIQVNSIPERECFRSWREFLEQLPNLISVELPTSVSGVVVGRDFPTDDDKDKVWFRRDQSGVFLGVYAFQNGAWRPFYNFAPRQVIWHIGNSDNIPEGFVMINTDDELITSTTVTAIKAQYVPNGLGGFEYFALRFVGF